ncbi:MAG TPA: histidine kinase dimerization/phospho-acceptor domain-containing protein, partial [Vicinamibacterales bacterium]|nr:histidine kinase dimerization/phospho-acceptor domain-containing protein [Vicinamibacterales bacterium]
MTNLMAERDEQARRMEAIGRLAGGVAHDFNNILTIILGYSEMILGSPSASEKVRQDAQAVLDATARATSLTRQLLLFSRRQDVKPQTIDVSDVLLSLEPRLRRLIPEAIALRVAGPS